MSNSSDEFFLKPTEREQELIQILSENPMISQAELAEKMGITRSSVSVYITNLTKKGIIRGRGYILANAGLPIIIGTANFDYIGTVDGTEDLTVNDLPLVDRAKLNISYAGFAKVVPEILSRFDCQAIPVFCVGNDIFGEQIIKELQESNIQTDHVQVIDGAHTAMYLELRDGPTGASMVTLSNLEIEKNVTPEFFKSRNRLLQNAGMLAIEDAIPAETVSYLVAQYPNKPVYFLSSSAARVLKYADSFSRFDLMVMSVEVAETIAGIKRPHDMTEDTFMVELARGVLQHGIKSMVIPFSARKLCYAEGNACYILEDDSGDDDAFRYGACKSSIFAAFLYSEYVHKPLLERLNFAAAARSISLKAIAEYNYQHRRVGTSSVETVLKNSSYKIQCLFF